MSTTEPEPMNEPVLNERQQKYVDGIVRGLTAREAARQAGFSKSYGRKSARLLRHPAIAQAIAAIRQEARTAIAYGVIEAMREASDAAKFAKANKQSMALVRAVELRARLSGLLIDRVEVVNVDLVGSLDRAKSRVLTILPPSAQSPPALPLPSKTATRWKPTIPGDGEDPADGRGGNAA